jgi:hypothetical protein
LHSTGKAVLNGIQIQDSLFSEKLTHKKIEAVKAQNFNLVAELRDQEKVIQAKIAEIQNNLDKMMA